MIQDTATFTIKSLDLYKIEPTTETDWRFLNKVIAEKLEDSK
jgi:hypothetical protein